MAEDDNSEPNIDEDDYYAFLNVARDATPEQIHQAYRRLSRLYHPDKHVDPALKKEAELLFNKTKSAFEVLSDPMQRAIYDSLGVMGLKEIKSDSGWEVMQRTMTPEEIRDQYERLAREHEQQKLNDLTKPKGTVTVEINATELFNSYGDESYESLGLLSRVEVSGMAFHQSVEAPLTMQDIVVMSGQLSTQNGTGHGSLCVSLRRLITEGNVEVAVDIGGGPVYLLKGHRSVTKHTFCDAGLTFHPTPLGINIGSVFGMGVVLDKHLLGLLKFRSGVHGSSLTTSLEYRKKKNVVSFNLQLGTDECYISLDYSRRLLDDALKLKLSGKYGTRGATVSYGAETRLSKHSKIGATVSLGVPSGVRLNITLVRASQVYMFPIHLCEDIMPAPVFYATVVPLTAWLLVKKLILEPIKREEEERDKVKKRKMKKNLMEQKQREAQAAVNLMSAQFERVRAEEESRRGLVIVQAVYGRLVASGASVQSTESPNPSEMIDVHIPLQCLVKDSKLVLPEASKSQLPGFYDPCLGEDKQLMVQYLFHNQMHEITIGDAEALRIPKTSHRLNPT